MMLTFVYWYQVEKSGVPDQSTTLIEQGIALYSQGQYAEVLQKIGEIPESLVRDWRIPYYKGSAQLMLGDYQEAVASLEQALVMNTQGTAILYALGVVYYKQGNIKLARAYFASALEIDPTDENAKGMMDIMAKLERMMSKTPISTTDQEKNEN